jgi:SAM-dependent methyltransferase
MRDTTALVIDPTNAAQAKAWDGVEGAYWADHATVFDRALGGYHAQFMSAAEVRVEDHVLDVGCGTGQTTRDAARAAIDGSALGMDLSERMVTLARRLAAEAGLANAAFERADAQVYPFPSASFDVAISRTGTMFFGDQVTAFANIRRALRPGGRLVLLTWQSPKPNEWIRELGGALAAGRDLPSPPPDAPGPFAQADPDRLRGVLEAAGLAQITLAGLRAPMWFGADPDDAYAFVLGLLGWMLDGLDDAGRGRALTNLRETVAAHHTSDGVTFESATWLVTARTPRS